MEILLSLEAFLSQHNLKGLRHLFDCIESNVRGLKALGVASSSYSGLLSSILINKLPAELRLVIGRQLGDEEWEFEAVMTIFEKELSARERSVGVATTSMLIPRNKPGRQPPPTATTLVNGSPSVICVYCNQPHLTESCDKVKTSEDRRQILRDSGRCFLCLCHHHLSRDCRSHQKCPKCKGRHHVSLCTSTDPAESQNRVQSTSQGHQNPLPYMLKFVLQYYYKQLSYLPGVTLLQ